MFDEDPVVVLVRQVSAVLGVVAAVVVLTRLDLGRCTRAECGDEACDGREECEGALHWPSNRSSCPDDVETGGCPHLRPETVHTVPIPHGAA